MTEDGQIDCCTGQNAVESCWIDEQRSFTRSGWPSLEMERPSEIAFHLVYMHVRAFNHSPNTSVAVSAMWVRITSYKNTLAPTSVRTQPPSCMVNISPRVKVTLRPRVRKSSWVGCAGVTRPIMLATAWVEMLAPSLCGNGQVGKVMMLFENEQNASCSYILPTYRQH